MKYLINIFVSSDLYLKLCRLIGMTHTQYALKAKCMKRIDTAILPKLPLFLIIYKIKT